jgi:hypothetical protein
MHHSPYLVFVPNCHRPCQPEDAPDASVGDMVARFDAVEEETEREVIDTVR